jgi:inner membrane protein YidH
MAEEKTGTMTISNTDLAMERTALAHERTLMAWIRTSVSLISFGFTIYKFFEEWNRNPNATKTLLTPREVGMLMIGFGLIALLLAQIQHRSAVKKLKKLYPTIQISVSGVLSILILIFGLMLFLGALFRQ